LSTTCLLLLLAAGSLARSTTAEDEPFNDEDVFNDFNDFDDLTDIDFGEDNPDFDNDRTLTHAQDRLGFFEWGNFSDDKKWVEHYKADWTHFYWIGGVIPFKISSDFTKKQKNGIFNTLKYLMKYTCLKFLWWKKVPESRQPIAHIMSFEKNSNKPWCETTKGRNGASTMVNLGSADCYNEGTTQMHEILHGLGFTHTQTRPDRDDYIIMHMENLGDEGKRDSFKKVEQYGVTHDMPYECHSIMHYKPYLWSHGGPMFEAKDKKTCQFPGQYSGTYAHPKYRMTANDMASINKVYCPKDRKNLYWKDDKQMNFKVWWNPPSKSCNNTKADMWSTCYEITMACSKSQWTREMKLYCPSTCMKLVKEKVCSDPDKFGLKKKYVKLCAEEKC